MQKHFLQPVRGTKDIYGDDAQRFSFIVDVARNMCDFYNFQEIILPIFEFSEIFHRTLGQTSDIVSKETYTFLDRDGSSITLRPEFTAAIVRSVIHSGSLQLLPQKYFSYGPVFRHERPQKARYRQFHQINFESIGLSDVVCDIELIMLAEKLLNALQIRHKTTLEISSLGNMESRMKYKEILLEYLLKYKNDLSEDSRFRLDKNPIRILDSKDGNDKKILENAPNIHASFDYESSSRFENLQLHLTNLSINHTLNSKLVRGLDYYTHTVFEYTTNELGAQGTVLAGGRYDGLFEMMGAPSTPAIGFAAGIERLMQIMDIDVKLKDCRKKLILLPIGSESCFKVPIIAEKLRLRNFNVDYIIHHNVSKQIAKANKVGADFIMMFGCNEISSGKFKIKDMHTGIEQDIEI